MFKQKFITQLSMCMSTHSIHKSKQGNSFKHQHRVNDKCCIFYNIFITMVNIIKLAQCYASKFCKNWGFQSEWNKM